MLNVGRIRMQFAMAVAQGVAVAGSSEPVDEAFFDAIADEEEVGSLAAKTNSERMKKAILAKYGV